jgi:hypothetical protein
MDGNIYKSCQKKIITVETYNGSACDGCSCGGSEILDGTVVAFFLPLFLFGFGGAGGGASES